MTSGSGEGGLGGRSVQRWWSLLEEVRLGGLLSETETRLKTIRAWGLKEEATLLSSFFFLNEGTEKSKLRGSLCVSNDNTAILPQGREGEREE